MKKKLLRKNIKKIAPEIDLSNPFIEKMIFMYIYQKEIFLKKENLMLELDRTNFIFCFNPQELSLCFQKSENIFKELMNFKLEVQNWDNYRLNSIHEYYAFLVEGIKQITDFDKNLYLHILNEQIKLIFLDQNIEKIKIFYDKKFDQKQYEKSVDLKIFFYEKLKKCVELMKLNYELDFNDNYFYFVNVLKEK